MSKIENISGLTNTPVLCDTILFQFKNHIIYSSAIKSYGIEIVGNLKKHYNDFYKKNKDKIIKKIIE